MTSHSSPKYWWWRTLVTNLHSHYQHVGGIHDCIYEKQHIWLWELQRARRREGHHQCSPLPPTLGWIVPQSIHPGAQWMWSSLCDNSKRNAGSSTLHYSPPPKASDSINQLLTEISHLTCCSWHVEMTWPRTICNIRPHHLHVSRNMSWKIKFVAIYLRFYINYIGVNVIPHQ